MRSIIVVLGVALPLFFSSSGCDCGGGGGLGNCPEEVCNGVDDDCDGETDEDEAWATKGETCFVGQGACQAAGVMICNENDRAGPLTCSGVPGTESVEVCNAVDDDCDGETDEEPHWSNRGDVCRVQVGGCVGVGVFICDPLSPDAPTICDAIAGPPTTEVCDGLDNDCDGDTDEGATWSDLGGGCSVGQGICQRPGLMVCDPNDVNGPTVCNAQPGAEGVEICNGLDDDCDGETDEETIWSDKGETCTIGQGICETPGIRLCDPANPAGPTICSATLRSQGVPEICNGLDDDCDGQTDEDAAWVDKGSLCSRGLGACQRTGVLVCDPTDPGGPTVCNAVAGAISIEVCDRVDNDCDGNTDEDAIWADLGDICREGSGSCETVGVRVCDTANPSGATVCSVSAGAGGAEVCNGLDDDCDGQTDEDALWSDKGSICTSGLGQCLATGTKVCDTTDTAGATVCSATPGAVGTEVCNGLDDDCDGSTDEDAQWTDKGTVCSVGTGQCTASGTRVCDTGDPAGPTVCSATPGGSGAEVCNGLDDDCDGLTDEDAPWANKGTVCSNGAGQCETSGTMVCDTADPAGPTVCSAIIGASGVEVCNGLDDDCDGQTDEDALWTDKGQVCAVGVGQCVATGTRVCDTADPAGPTVCSATPGAPGTEVCNALDDDCDGSTDELTWADKGTICTSGAGACQQTGTRVCDTADPTGPTVCSVGGGAPGTEICNGFDDDCDGQTDEGTWADLGDICRVGTGACEVVGVLVCDTGNPAGPSICSVSASAPGSEVCNGLDDDCDGSTDEEAQWADKGAVCTVGAGQCSATGTRVCDTANPGGPTVCSATANAPGSEICNGLDDDCDGSTDEDAQWTDKGTVCTVGTGQCASTGTRVCDGANPAGPTICSAVAGASGTEICNALDDDCDGSTDEDALWADKGAGCTAGTGQCTASGVKVCDVANRAGATVCSATPFAPGSEVCNALDDDCDGSTDEDAQWTDKGTVCVVGSGQCAATGTRVCDTANPGGPTVCSATPGAPGSEVCNALDDDCDGSTDELVWADKGDICTSGSGACERTGTRVCDTASPAGPTICSATPGAPGVEVCNGLDDDCDGSVDEDSWTNLGVVCKVGDGICENLGVRVCDTANPGGPTVCSVSPGSPAIEVCNGLDDDCDGLTDEGAAWSNKGTPCLDGTGQCQVSGTMICDAGNPGGPTVCSATAGGGGAEVCNGLDDDCDGLTDEEAQWADKGVGCTSGTGQCVASGVKVCDTANPTGPTVCSATAGAPSAEICNALDDDCDGSTDEDAQWSDKGTVCTNGAGTCETSGTKICDAANRAGPTICSAVAGAPGSEVCNGLDDDCDGSTDEDPQWSDKGVGCTAGTGQCVASGVKVCNTADRAGATVCSATAGAPGAEVCNGLDDDCDGSTDEEPQWADKGAVCSNGAGTCENSGTKICDTADPAGPTVCSAIIGAPGVEVCNGLDDDCDGSTDEGGAWADKGVGCTAGVGQCSASGVRVCDTGDPAGPTVCSATPGSPGAEVCNALDDDCDGATDEVVWADKGTICTSGTGTCERTGVRVCDTADPGGPTVCSVSSGAPGSEVCNGLDDDCDGSTDEDALWSDKGTGCTSGTGQCLASGTKICDPGDPAGATVCSATPGAAGTEVCNGLDDDCDGGTDEVVWADKGTICTAGTGTCEQTGVRVCDTGNPGGPTVCSVSGGSPGIEVCNGLDDDCDSSTDEGALWSDKGAGCTSGTGVCQASGTKICNAGDPAGATVCSATPGAPGSEICDALDNDCDGAIDEIVWADKGTICTAGTGACQQTGTRVCDTGNPAGPTVCSATASAPGAEICNGFDDDCDGSTDEGTWANKGTICTVGAGACEAVGVLICDTADPAGPSICSVTAGAPGSEVCNGLDDDCDGLTDEILWADKGTTCSVGTGQCTAYGVKVCDTGTPGGPTVCSVSAGAPVAELCNGLDDDCDGSTDEEVQWADKGTVCTVGAGQCAATGTKICDAGSPAGPTVCSATPGAGATEVCNSLDDDCDGSTDEVTWADKGQVCTVGTGQCVATGTRICDTGSPAGPTICSATAGSGSAEICNGLDDDCDGGTDEDALWVNKGEVCTSGTGTCLRSGTLICDTGNPGGAMVCSATAGAPGTEVCNGLDDDCDGSTDELTWADKGDICTVGTGACQQTGTLVCNAGNPSGPTICSASAGSGSAEICNGLDDDCDSLTDEGALWADKGTGCSAGTGICAASGVKVCDTADPAGATVCSATPGVAGAEVCNGLDDDCDGSTDEVTWADKGDLCTVGTGTCEATGVLVCNTGNPAGPTVCSASAGAPGTEVCNALDDDCDGSTDELSWTDKGQVCTVGAGQCAVTGTRICDTTSPAGPTVCSASAGAPGTEVCNSLDDDCDGLTDEVTWADKGQLCTSGTGQCAATGTRICDTADPAGPTVCSATAGAPGTEVCNALDDDCDGLTDEVTWADKGDICTAGTGACARTGTRICDTGSPAGPTVCSVSAGSGSAEVCNGLDDDCDTLTDEGALWADLGVGCISGDGVCARPGIKICDTGSPAGPSVCSATPGAPGTEVCNGLDDDCDTSTDEGGAWADKGDACTEGVGICLAAGVRVCDLGDPAGPTVCTASAGVPGSESCNGLDDDCDNSIDDNLAAPGCLEQDGVCNGSVQTCGGGLGWLACTGPEYGVQYEPTELTCDGLDNSCDGNTDVGIPSQLCGLQSGVCNGAVATCSGGAWGACGAAEYGPEYEASEASCDQLDNDCDGTTDEGWLNGGKYDQHTACGNCYTDCTAIYARPNAYGTCDASGSPNCVMTCCTIGDPNPACDGLYDYADADLVVSNGCEFQDAPDAVYVSTPGNGGIDAPTCGPANTPCATVSYGINIADTTAGKSRVLVSGGAYYENPVMADGISVLGGHNPTTWARDPAANTTVIYGSAGAVSTPDDRAVVTFSGITRPTELSGFVIFGEFVNGVSGNSAVIDCSDCDANVMILDNTLYAGNAGSGADGGDGATGSDGVNGFVGIDATEDGTCPAWPKNTQPRSVGGSGGILLCGATAVSGGQGGRAYCPDFDESSPLTDPFENFPTADAFGLPGLGGAGGSGGSAGWDGMSYDPSGPSPCSCYQPSSPAVMEGGDGLDGATGSNGGGGAGCALAGGAVVAGRWVGNPGATGQDGDDGSGGGGGGVGGGVQQVNCSPGDAGTHDLGGSGGGGGSGGCGGGGGDGGSAGGGSFGIFLHFASIPAGAPQIAGNTIVTGFGGIGGSGGNGGFGGIGGTGAAGGALGDAGSLYWCAAGGGRGGEGGNGGNAAGGGGACGGVSVGIYSWGQGGTDFSAINAANTFQLSGNGGTGGSGGLSLSANGTDGASGVHQATNF
ncbi:MAG: MopE-related protein [Deltaproteobacteria bacterium]|nr:MopE-related protein [Deltaproteobacteria bacterium]